MIRKIWEDAIEAWSIASVEEKVDCVLFGVPFLLIPLFGFLLVYCLFL